MAFKSRLLNFYRTQIYATFKIVLHSLFYIIKRRPIAYLSVLTQRNKSCMQTKNGLNMCKIARQGIVLLRIYRNTNSSGLRDLGKCSHFDIQNKKGLKSNSAHILEITLVPSIFSVAFCRLNLKLALI